MALNQKIVSDIAEKLGMPEVLTQFLAPEVPEEEVNPFADALTGVHVFNQTDLTTRLTNERAAAALEAKNNATGNAYDAMDKRIKAETGVEKQAGEKTIDYLARAAKEKYSTKSNESDEITRLREDVAAKEELLRTKDTELQNAATKLQGMEVEYATKLESQRINAKLDAAINAIKIDAPDSLLPGQRKLLKVEFDERFEAKVVDGKTIFIEKATGKEKRDSKLAQPMSAEEIINEFAPSVVSVKKVQKNGTGLNAAVTPPQPGSEDLREYPTLDAYKKHLASNGITLISAEGQQGIARYLAYEKSKK